MAAPDRKPPGRRRPCILVVEDDEAVRQMVARLLRDLADVVEAQDAQDALAKVREGLRPDLVISDLMMPGMDGLSLARRLKEDAATACVPVIMLTAKGRPKDVIAGIQAGARSYITKPFQQDELIRKVKSALRL